MAQRYEPILHGSWCLNGSLGSINLAKDQIECDFCIVGAGFAGLTAALRLTQKGHSVMVVESRDRTGGKVWTKYLDDGTPIDLGGTFLGPTQDRIYSLLRELELEITPTPIKGDSQLVYKDKYYRYGKEAPDVDSQSLEGVWKTLQMLSKMSLEVPYEAPWTSLMAREWDSMSLGQFLHDPAHDLNEPALSMLRLLFISLFTVEPSEISLLYVLFQIAASGNDIELQMKVEGGADQDMLKGGMMKVVDKLCAKIDETPRNWLLLSSPVKRIMQDDFGATVISQKAIIKAKRVIVAIPPNLASKLEYEPPLPTTRMQLLQQMPAGRCIKFITVHDRPFWRESGLSGEVSVLDEYIQLTLDTSPPDTGVGVLMSFAFSKEAEALGSMDEDGRKKHLLATLIKHFGREAASPIHYFEHDWYQDEWTRGCHVAHLVPGVMTSCGHAIREPFGRIHWATSESSPLWNGNIDGAVRAGEFVAKEVSANI